MIPLGSGSPLVRTFFGDDRLWVELVEAATALSSDGLAAYLDVIDDRAHEGLTPEGVARLASGHAVVFIADERAMRDAERPILCVEPIVPFRSFRVVPDLIWAPENNLSFANMDFEEFLDAADADGVLRRLG